MTSHNQQRQLIPGLPNYLALDCLLPRIPWHTRPRMRSVSKAWKEALDGDLAAYAALTRRDGGLRDGLVILHRIVPEEWCKNRRQGCWIPPPIALSIYDDESKQWRLLPPIPSVRHPLRLPCVYGVACVDRKLFVMGGCDPVNFTVCAQVYMLDLGSGLWQWERRSNMRAERTWYSCLSVAGKIYVHGNFHGSRGFVKNLAPEAYNVDRDQWSLLPPVDTQQRFRAPNFAAAGQQLIAVGSVIKDMAWKVYDPVAKLWSDWDCDHVNGSAFRGGYYELRQDGIVYKLDNSRKHLWTAFKEVDTCLMEWRGPQIGDKPPSVEGYLFVNEVSKPHVYAIIGYGTEWRLWRGALDHELKTVAWREVETPGGNLCNCGNMCYFH